MYDKVVLDENFLNSLANHDQRIKGPLIFTPTHKSYIDFLIASYIFYAFKIKCPHVAAAEDFL
jgi:glycerone phosphate O-acyltransferase/fatty acyl-CoA reductase